MRKQFEYQFVRLGEGLLGAKKAAWKQYQEVISVHAQAGWRLVQIFTPGLGAYGTPTFIEIVLEREVEAGEPYR